MAAKRECGEDDGELRRQLRIYTGQSVGPITKSTRSLLTRKLQRYNARHLEDSTQDFGACDILLPSDRLSEELTAMEQITSQNGSTDGHTSYSDFTALNDRSSSESPLTRPSIHSSKLKNFELSNRSVNINEIFKSNEFCRQNQEKEVPPPFATNDLYFNDLLNKTPSLLLAASVIFFTVTMFCYLYHSYNTIVFTDQRDDFLICPKTWSVQYGSCFLQTSLEKIQSVVAMILVYTSVRSGEQKCGEREEAAITVDEMVEMLENSEKEIDTLSLLKLFQKNPHWGVRLLDDNQQDVVNTNQVRLLLNSKYVLSWSCRLSTLLTDCAYISVVLAVVVVGALTAKSIHSYFEWWAEVENLELNSLMERVIDLLKSQATISTFAYDTQVDPWLCEDYIFRTLLLTEDYSGKMKLWKKALQILRKHESRLAFKTQVIIGKEVLMLRWMTLSSLISSSSSSPHQTTMHTKRSLPSATFLHSETPSLHHRSSLPIPSSFSSSLSSSPSSSLSSSPPSFLRSQPSHATQPSIFSSSYSSSTSLFQPTPSPTKTTTFFNQKESQHNYHEQRAEKDNNNNNHYTKNNPSDLIRSRQHNHENIPDNEQQQQATSQRQHSTNFNNTKHSINNHNSNTTSQHSQINNNKNIFQANSSPLKVNHQHNNTHRYSNNNNNPNQQHLINNLNPLQLSTNNNNHNTLKCWQGSAISGPKSCHGNGFFNNIPPLTKCLKVRDMFDIAAEVGDSSWQQVVKDSILEKVGMDHNILQIAIDRNSKEGCVYIRCGDLAGAGQVFERLHGWWFDGRLVTVKYLKLKRFLERFPDDSCNKTPLLPSNDRQLSLSIPAYKSVLEDT